jgi:hypothetical protein
MTTHRQPRHDDSRYTKAASKYSVSHMSDSKWLRLFRAIDQSDVPIDHARWSFIDDDFVMWQGFPREKDLLEHRFNDGRFQPFDYRWIRSIFIPREYRPWPVSTHPGHCFIRTQDVDRVRGVIEAAGEFKLVESEDGLTILAYER